MCISVKSHNILVKHLKLMQNHEDFELRKLLVNILVTLSRDTAALSVSNLKSLTPSLLYISARNTPGENTAILML